MAKQLQMQISEQETKDGHSDSSGQLGVGPCRMQGTNCLKNQKMSW